MLNKLLCGATLLCAASLSQAATIVFSDVVDETTTNFTTTVELAKFDDLGGTRVLDAVTFSIDGDIFGIAEVESRDAEAATILTTLSAELTLTDALMNTLVVSVPTVTNTFEASAFDGSLDFDGSSGFTLDNLTASKYEEKTFIDAPTLAFFSGSGVANFVFDANATSSATGAGNLTTGFSTSAGGLVSVMYTYSEFSIPVSAPTGIAIIALALLAFVGVRRFSK